MRVLEITYTWPPETFIVRHAEALARYMPIDLIIGARSPAKPQSASIQPSVPLGYKSLILPNFDHLSLPKKIYLSLKSLKYVDRINRSQWNYRERVVMDYIERTSPDLVHFHTSSLAVMMSNYLEAIGIPYTMSLRGKDIQVLPIVERGYLEKLCQVASSAKAIHTVVDAFSSQLHELCDTHFICTTIRTCIPQNFFQRNQPSGNGVDIRFISVGRLHWTKAFDDLVRAIALLPPNLSLDIVGDGPEHEYLSYLVDSLGLMDRVYLHGNLPFSEFHSLLTSATAYVQSSVTEGFSNALAEAMAMGLPVFVTDAGGTSEIIQDGQNGYLIPVGDPRGIAEILTKAQSSDNLEKIGNAAYTTALREFEPERHAVSFFEFYQIAIAK